MLRGLIGLGMLRARNPRTVAQALQIVPAPAWVHGTAKLLLHPGCHFWTAPEPTVGWRLLKRFIQSTLLLRREQGGHSRKRPTMVADALFASGIPAPDDGADPSSGISK